MFHLAHVHFKQITAGLLLGSSLICGTALQNKQVHAESFDGHSDSVTLFSDAHENDNTRNNDSDVHHAKITGLDELNDSNGSDSSDNVNNDSNDNNKNSNSEDSDKSDTNTSSDKQTVITVNVHKGDKLLDVANQNHADLQESAKLNDIHPQAIFVKSCTVKLVYSHDDDYKNNNIDVFNDAINHQKAQNIIHQKAKKIADSYERDENNYLKKLQKAQAVAVNKEQAAIDRMTDKDSTSSNSDSLSNSSNTNTSSNHNSTGDTHTEVFKSLPSMHTYGTNINSMNVGSRYHGQNLHSYVLNKISRLTGQPKWVWNYIITHESSWNPTIRNSIGCYGLFQLAPCWNADGTDIDTQIATAARVYRAQGLNAWETWTNR